MNREQFLQEFSNLTDRENLQEVYGWFEDKFDTQREAWEVALKYNVDEETAERIKNAVEAILSPNNKDL